MNLRRFRPVVFAAFVVAAAALAVTFAGGAAGGDNQSVRWDIISIDFTAGTTSAGGVASARAADGSKITLTGNGTFTEDGDDEVSGGGTWKTFDAGGTQTGSGTYTVTGLVSFILAPGAPPPLVDLIGNPADRAAGLAIMRVRYSDGNRGVLIVSCHLVGTPNSVFEGITATKSFVDYFNAEPPPAPPGDANRTLFHVSGNDE